MDLTPDGGAAMPIAVAADDPIGPSDLAFTRSLTDPLTGSSASNPLEQVTEVTAFLDLSQVYGSDQATADALRTFSGGLLKTSPGNDLPYDNATYFTAEQLTAMNEYLGGMQNDGPLPSSEMFATGDIRGNENLELTALETLFVRNHNLLAGELHKLHPQWSDEQLYQEARQLNIAEYQAIVYNEWIPSVLGVNALAPYKGYKSNVDPSITTEFSTVAFRFGHSLVSGDIERDTNSGQPIADVSPDGSSIPLAQDFFDPNLLDPAGVVDPLTGHISSDIGAVLKAEADGNSQAMDVMAINDIRNLLFGNAGDGGDDLIARDIQRGRDNGIPSYNALRVAYGLPAVTSFAQITSNVQVQQALEQAYGSVDNIDAFEGGLAEDHVRGADVGPLFRAIMVDQFTRLRDGDRFFYLNESFSPDEMRLFQQGDTLAKVIEANTDITNLQANVFLFATSISGHVALTPAMIGNHPCLGPNRGGAAAADATVNLVDSNGAIVATTTTDAHGNYRFTGIALGTYTVEVTSSAGGTSNYDSQTVSLTRSEALTDIDLGLLSDIGGHGPQGLGGGLCGNHGPQSRRV